MSICRVCKQPYHVGDCDCTHEPATPVSGGVERAAFESWATKQDYNVARRGLNYRSTMTTFAWVVWQAALAPRPTTDPGDGNEGTVTVTRQEGLEQSFCEQVVDAIASREGCSTTLEIVCAWREKYLRPFLAQQPAPQPTGWNLPAEGVYLIRFEDSDCQDEVFAGPSARDTALRRYKTIGAAWNAHLFAKVDTNFLSDKYPNAQPTGEAVAECSRDEAEALLRPWPSPYIRYNDSDAPAGYVSLFDAETVLTLVARAVSKVRTPAASGDAELLDWLERHHVEVCLPLAYGSRSMFHASPDDREDANARSDLREQIRAAIAANPPEAVGGKETT